MNNILSKRTLTAIILGCSLLGTLGVQAQTIKIGTIAPKGSPWHDALMELSQEWKKISNGRIKVLVYADGVAGDEPVMLRKIRVGQLHGAALTTISLIPLEPDLEVLSFPTLIHNDEELDHLIDTVGPELESRLEDKGLKLLNWTSTGWVRFFTKDPVNNLKDLQEHKIIFWGEDAVYISFLKKMGIKLVPLAVTDMLPSLQTGLANAFGAPPAVALAFQWFGLAKNMTDLPWQPIPGTVVISTKKWRTIPASMKPDLMKAAEKVGVKLMERSRQVEVDAIATMKKHGLKVTTLAEAESTEWRRLMREEGEPLWVGPRISPTMFNRVVDELEKYRAKK